MTADWPSLVKSDTGGGRSTSSCEVCDVATQSPLGAVPGFGAGVVGYGANIARVIAMTESTEDQALRAFGNGGDAIFAVGTPSSPGIWSSTGTSTSPARSSATTRSSRCRSTRRALALVRNSTPPGTVPGGSSPGLRVKAEDGLARVWAMQLRPVTSRLAVPSTMIWCAVCCLGQASLGREQPSGQETVTPTAVRTVPVLAKHAPSLPPGLYARTQYVPAAGAVHTRV